MRSLTKNEKDFLETLYKKLDDLRDIPVGRFFQDLAHLGQRQARQVFELGRPVFLDDSHRHAPRRNVRRRGLVEVGELGCEAHRRIGMRGSSGTLPPGTYSGSSA